MILTHFSLSLSLSLSLPPSLSLHSNSPIGSALCVYTFGSNANDLERVFQGKYLEQTGLGQFSEQANNDHPHLVCVSKKSTVRVENFSVKFFWVYTNFTL